MLVKEARIQSNGGGTRQVRYGDRLLKFPTKKGKTYCVHLQENRLVVAE